MTNADKQTSNQTGVERYSNQPNTQLIMVVLGVKDINDAKVF